MASSTHKGAVQHRLKPLRKNMKLDRGGQVAELVAESLIDQSASLQDIADRVQRLIPTASTSARSVASIAAQLRRDGYNVPDRRHGNGRATPRQVVAKAATKPSTGKRASH